MSKTFRSDDPDQQLLLPAALQEWLPENQLGLSEITARYGRESTGGPPYNPWMMVKVLLYG